MPFKISQFIFLAAFWEIFNLNDGTNASEFTSSVEIYSDETTGKRIGLRIFIFSRASLKETL